MDIKRVLIFNTAQAIDLVGGSQNAIEDAIEVLLRNRVYVEYISYRFNSNVILNDKTDFLKRYFIIKFTKNIFKWLLSLYTAYKEVNNKNYDIVWVNSAMPYIFFSFFIKSSKIIYTFHGPVLEEQKYSAANSLKMFLTKQLYKKLILKTSFIHFNTSYVKESVNKEFNFTKTKKNIIIETLVDGNKFINKYKNSINTEFNIYDILKINSYDKFVILIPRRLVKRTGVYDLLLSIKKLDPEKLKKFKFLITGEGPEKDSIIHLINQMNINFDITYLGELSNTNLENLFFKVDCICIPSIAAEGFCLPAKQAKLINKIIIHSGQGGLNETLLNYNYDFVFNPKNPDSLLEVLNIITQLQVVDYKSNNEHSFEHNLNLLFNY